MIIEALSTLKNNIVRNEINIVVDVGAKFGAMSRIIKDFLVFNDDTMVVYVPVRPAEN